MLEICLLDHDQMALLERSKIGRELMRKHWNLVMANLACEFESRILERILLSFERLMKMLAKMLRQHNR